MGEKQKEAEKKDTPRTNKTHSKKEKLIYIGPNLIQLTKYTVLDEIPKHIEDLTKKCPAIKKLFVPIEKLAESEQRAKRKGTLEHKYVQEVFSFLEERRKGDK